MDDYKRNGFSPSAGFTNFRWLNRWLIWLAWVSVTLYSNILYGQTERPNILWIVSEDNNVSVVGCYGNSYATTPNIDKLAREGVLFRNAFATAPVCAPSRCTIITGMYPPTLGTEHMRSAYDVPTSVKFFPRYLREAGYYTTNNAKKDYNTTDQTEAWDESSNKATYRNRKPGQPFFAVFNIMTSHESSIHTRQDSLRHDPDKVPLPAYHPDTKEMRMDWAQYYDKVETMDQQVGKLLKELEDEGLSESTIVFYYGDNGGVLPRSKRFMYESGLHIPLVIRVPEKYRKLSPYSSGHSTDRLVSFTDFAPTILTLAGVDVPANMQGVAFMGLNPGAARRYTYAFRGRMDERNDLSRSVRDKKYRYIRNYLPHLIYGQHVMYQWQASSMQSWENEFRKGNLNSIQSAFWMEKPPEELFDVDADPDNVKNLASDPAYDSVLRRFRNENRKWLLKSHDIGFIPEALLYTWSAKGPLQNFGPGQKELDRIIETAEMASLPNRSSGREIVKRLRDKDPSVRYWAALGCTILGTDMNPAVSDLKLLLNDSEGAVRVAAAEALYELGETEEGFSALLSALKHDNLFVRVQALNVLQSLGDEAKPAIEYVKQLIPSGPLPNPGQDTAYDLRAARSFLESVGR